MLLNAQNSYNNTEDAVMKKVLHEKDIISFLEQKYYLEKQNIKLKRTGQSKSLTAIHYDFELYFKDLKIESLYIKAHVNFESELFLVQHNVSVPLSISNIEEEVSKEDVYRRLFESYTIDQIDYVLLQKNNSFVKAVKVIFYEEEKAIYKQRVYTKLEDFDEVNLKNYFAPIDTLLSGKVFLPDPLTSSEMEYGGFFRDTIEKDTSLLILQTISKTGQNFVTSDTNTLNFYDTMLVFHPQTVSNSFTGNEIYYCIKVIQFDGNKIERIETQFVDDISMLKTRFIFEDFDFSELNNQQVAVDIMGDYSAGAFRLKNKAFEIVDFSSPANEPAFSINNQFEYNRSESEFEDFNAFYHLNNFYNYIESLGFDNLDPTKLRIDAHGSEADNSFFVNVPSPRLSFGDGGVDDAEDADVIVHEYGHALSFFASPNSNIGAERQAIDEALGDYFSSSYSWQYSNFNFNNVFSWDGHNEYWNGRVTNSELTAEDIDLSNSIYYNAQIWSSTLIDIFNELNKATCDSLVLESMYYNTKDERFDDAANHLFLIDSILFESRNKCTIQNVLNARKFKKEFCDGDIIFLEDNLYAFNTLSFAQAKGNAIFYLIDNKNEAFDLFITNAIGKLVYQQKNIVGNRVEVSPETFSNGIYYLRFQSGKKNYKFKLLKLIE